MILVRRQCRLLFAVTKIYSSSLSRRSISESYAYCVQLVRQVDYENHLCTLQISVREARFAVFAIRAFNAELARIRDTVSSKIVGQMRFQFWREALDRVYAGVPPQHPVAEALTVAVNSRRLSRLWLTDLLHARESTLDDKPFLRVRDMEDYFQRSIVAVLFLTLEAMNVRNLSADHAASHVGKALGLVNVLRAIPYHAKQNRVLLPVELLMSHSVSQEDLLRGRRTTAVRDLVFDLAGQAHIHLEHARKLSADVPRRARVALLSAAVCDHYLRVLQMCAFDPFDEVFQGHYRALLLVLFWRRLLGRY